MTPDAPHRDTKIWDLPTRLFHWGLVATVAAAALTGFFAPPAWADIHAALGIAVLALVAFRILWGGLGPRHSRFSSFLFSPRETWRFVTALLAGHPPRHAGHNPAGALMVFALLGALAGLTVSGLAAWGGVEKKGPFADAVSYALGHGAGEIHEGLAVALLVLIAAHVAGVLLESRLGGERLVRSMVSGTKRVGGDALPTGVTVRRSVAGVAVLGGLLGAALVTLPALRSAAVPPDVAGTAYARDCGDCHHAFHPSLLAEGTWTAMMDGLGDHFGEDASLSPKAADAIRRYLSANAADHFDTKGANRFRTMDPQAPLSITATKSWRRIHRDIAPATFKDRRVGSKTNCRACHADAAVGLFAKSEIHIPETKK